MKNLSMIKIQEFKSFSKIKHYAKIEVTITQKIHGTNSQIYIFETPNGLDLLCGCRSRWITPEDDNYGFARFVYQNKQEFIEKLGVGRHFGEWAGPGINSGEGLKEKTLFLFNWRKFNPIAYQIGLLKNVRIIPIISGFDWTNHDEFDLKKAIDSAMDFLKKGSLAVLEYMKPEGVVIEIDGVFYKKVFDNEEIKWKQTEKIIKIRPSSIDIIYLLQPIRLEKLLSRDEKYIREYPNTLPAIFSDYVKDLEEENQIIGTEDEIKAIKKALGRELFKFVKEFIKTRYSV